MKKSMNIYKRKDGRYEGRIPYDRDSNGKLKYRYLYAKNYSDLKEKMIMAYTLPKTESCIKTLRELTLEWLYSISLRVKESSYCCYERIATRHIIPYFEDTDYKNIDTVKINDFVEYLLKYGKANGVGGLCVQTVREVLTTLRLITKYAESKYSLPNPIKNVYIPKSDKKLITILNETERYKLQEYLLNNLNNSNLGILITMYSGLRIGEICALKWNDIDLGNGVINISKTVQRIKDNSEKENKTKLYISKPKSSSSVREIPLPEFILKILRENKQDNNCFVLSGTSKLVEPRTMQYRFKSVLNLCGIRTVTFHTLRHTYATLCIEKGFDVKTVSELLGHSNVNITLNRYVHSSIETKKKYVERLVIF